jgi:hypothetical protein
MIQISVHDFTTYQCNIQLHVAYRIFLQQFIRLKITVSYTVKSCSLVEASSIFRSNVFPPSTGWRYSNHQLSRRKQQAELYLQPAYFPYLRLWRRRQYIPSNHRWNFTRLDGVTFQKIQLFLVIVLGATNPADFVWSFNRPPTLPFYGFLHLLAAFLRVTVQRTSFDTSDFNSYHPVYLNQF